MKYPSISCCENAFIYLLSFPRLETDVIVGPLSFRKRIDGEIDLVGMMLVSINFLKEIV
jgi:hypothetical protein